MFKPNYKSLSLSTAVILMALSVAVSCSKKEDEKVEEKQAETVTVELEKIEVSADIMTPLAGTDPCFEAVELVRDDQDLSTYRDFGDKILLDKDYVERHGHKTYIGTIGKLLKEDRSIAEIRQVLLNKCRAFGVAYEKAKAEAAAKANEAGKPKEAAKANEDARRMKTLRRMKLNKHFILPLNQHRQPSLFRLIEALSRNPVYSIFRDFSFMVTFCQSVVPTQWLRLELLYDVAIFCFAFTTSLQPSPAATSLVFSIAVNVNFLFFLSGSSVGWLTMPYTWSLTCSILKLCFPFENTSESTSNSYAFSPACCPVCQPSAVPLFVKVSNSGLTSKFVGL